MESSFPLENTLYTAEEAQLWQCTRTTGVYSSEKDLVTLAVGGMRVSVGGGIAWLNLGRFKGIVYGNTETVYFDIEQADGVLKRYDRIVVRYDFVENETRLIVKKGVFSASPVPPDIERVSGAAFEIAIADIFVNRGVTEIIQSDITDKRLDETVCGVMTDGVKGIPTQMLIAQWESWFKNFKDTTIGDGTELTEWIYLFKQQSTEDWNEFMALKELDFESWSEGRRTAFEAWFDTVRGRLGTDLAGGLQLQILDVERLLFTTRDINNLLQFPDCGKVVDFSVSGRILTTIESKETGLKIAENEVTFPPGRIQKVITLYEADGVSVARREIYTTSFEGGGIVTV